MLLEDVREQFEIAPRTLGLDKQSSHHLVGSIVNGPNQTQPRPPALEPVMWGAIDLEHHSFTGSSFSTASVLDAAALLGGADPVGTQELADLLPAQLDLFLLLELLGQMVIVESLVFPSG